MLLLLARDWMLFSAAVLMGGAALAPREFSSRLESWCVGMAGAVAVLGAGVFLPYVFELGTECHAAGCLALLAAIVSRRKMVVEIVRDPEVQSAAASWGWITLGGFALLACVPSYSGGLWMGDWEEHYQRPLLFLRLRPEDEEFRRLFTLTARPPLANVADAAFLWATGAAFPRHQTFMLLLNSLAFFPVALFSRTFGGGRAAAAWVACCVLLNPVFLQNATYAWTKLITVFFVLAGLHVWLAGQYSRRRTVWGAGLLGLAVITHYSACVWVLVFGAVWLIAERRRWNESGFWPTCGRATLAFAAVLAPWLGYALHRYGAAATFGSNSTIVTGAQYSWPEHLQHMGLKLWTTIVPHPLRAFDRSAIAQGNLWAELRDQIFYVYQSNLLFAFGTPVLLILLWIAWRREWPRLPTARVWPIAVPLVIVLGTAVHGTPDDWGLAHICLQPLTFLGVAVAAAQLPELSRNRIAPWLMSGAVAGWALDFLLGIALHYSAAAYQLNRGPNEHLMHYVPRLSAVAQHNFWRKIELQLNYFADAFEGRSRMLLVAFAALAVFAAWRAWRLSRPQPACAAPPHLTSTARPHG